MSVSSIARPNSAPFALQQPIANYYQDTSSHFSIPLDPSIVSFTSPLMIMAIICFSRLRARVSGRLLEGANVSILARSKPYVRGYNATNAPKTRPLIVPHKSYSRRSLATVGKGSSLERRVSLHTAEQVLYEELETAASVVKPEAVPSEAAVQRALKICENLAESVVVPTEPSDKSHRLEKTPTSNLLSLDELSRAPVISSLKETPLRQPLKGQMAHSISSTAYSIVTDPRVFITSGILATYIHTQSLLGRPQSFPYILDLYASKRIPQPGRVPIEYKDANPNRASSAVPLVVAHTALKAAIAAKDLPLCLSIIDISVCTSAYRRNKILRHALMPFSGLALAPAAAYVLAAHLAQYQHSMDHQVATNTAFVGILAYIGFTTMIGFVAITTANDQMDRITWATGIPLRERWSREDERALVDQVAGAWGFQDETKRGEEEGGDWEALREWALMRGMVLDKPELMTGME